ncbi:hypothetical protein E8E11_002767 [Didymella keratinophila]|uniref:Uncharacterized protein n=1 Tax=Didymella heteroderae TaxID=1769908 RepID=A0A9P5BTV6_9PLEO|nr:hypothetical protein E8E12_000256 [Didymella heteroderae]KAF3036738.1 hypothetical protein E8E11_002767 [Didymella keratinophila]
MQYEFPRDIEVDGSEYYGDNVEHSPGSPALRGSDATQDVDPSKLDNPTVQPAGLTPEMHRFVLDAIMALLKTIFESNGGFLSLSSSPREGSPHRRT